MAVYVHLKSLLTQLSQEMKEGREACLYFLQKLIHNLIYWVYVKKKSYQFKKALQIATNYEQWERQALELDKLYGHSRWKYDPRSEFYDYRNARYLLMYLKQLRKNKIDKGLVYTLRSHLNKNLYGIANPLLY